MESLSLKQKYIIAGAVVMLAIAGFIILHFKQSNDIVIDQGVQASLPQGIPEQQPKKGPDTLTLEETKQEELQIIIVDVSGQVENPGIVELAENSRVNDAVKKAGGVTSLADLNQINLAEKVTDGEKIYVPKKGENIPSVASQTKLSQSGLGQSIVNINTADKDELDNIPGVGPSTAEKIIDYRNKNGAFKKIEDVKNVTGIGDKKYESIKKYIST